MFPTCGQVKHPLQKLALPQGLLTLLWYESRELELLKDCLSHRILMFGKRKKLKRFENFESIWVFVTVRGVLRHTAVVLPCQVVHSFHKVHANARSELSWGLRDHRVCVAKNAVRTLRLCTDPWWKSIRFLCRQQKRSTSVHWQTELRDQHGGRIHIFLPSG